jgi:NAD(P)-dependent dehydrogenase (short-subunit alcohol dehydrogenase family)
MTVRTRDILAAPNSFPATATQILRRYNADVVGSLGSEERAMPAVNNAVSRAKVALVTGGSRGIGKAIALALAKAGIGVVLTYHSNKTEGDRVVEEIRASGGVAVVLQLDVAATSSFDMFLEKVRGVLPETFDAANIDFLINNAGFGKAIPIDNLTEGEFDSFVDVHFKGVVFLTQKTLRMMNDGGGVVFITAAGDRYNVPAYATYAACKGAVEVFSRYVAKEYGARGIRSNTVAPGGIVTDFNNAAIRSNPKVQEWIIAQTPMGRLGEAHDIGDLVALLCSDDARWMTGQRLEATGGFNL